MSDFFPKGLELFFCSGRRRDEDAFFLRRFWKQGSFFFLFWLVLTVVLAFSVQTLRDYAGAAGLIVCTHHHAGCDEAADDADEGGATPCSAACHIHHGTVAILIEWVRPITLHAFSMGVHLPRLLMPDAPVQEIDHPPQLLS